MKHTVTLIPGDGIGPEIVAATVRIVEAAGIDIEWETQTAKALTHAEYLQLANHKQLQRIGQPAPNGWQI